MITLRWIFRTWGVGMDWIDLFQYSDRWWALGYEVMNFGFYKMRGIS
jgi:hypothetical protein